MLRYPALAAALAVAARARWPSRVAPPSPAALSPRNASYVISVKLDATKKTLDGRETITWRNIQDAPTSELWFHLYFNGFRNSRSTWMLEDRLRGRMEPGAARHRGRLGVGGHRTPSSCRGRHDGMRTSPRPMQFVAADGDVVNPDDRTVVKVPLPRAVGPGESVSVEVSFTAKVPRTFARTGFRGDYYFLSHWYPALGVYEKTGAWNCHQFHASTEFFSDYGVYDVTMTVPRGWVVGATGRQTERRDGPTAPRTSTSRPTCTTSPGPRAPTTSSATARFEVEGLPPVDMRLLFQPEHAAQVDRHFAATRAALENYGKWYGPYPYGHITIIDPRVGSRAGGMEYPTLFTRARGCGTRSGGGSPEGVTIHEAGHQFWYGISGNNELEHAWLDEGLNRFSDRRAYDVTYGAQTLVRRYLRLPTRGGANRDTTGSSRSIFPGISDDRSVRVVNGYRGGATAEVPARLTFQLLPGRAPQHHVLQDRHLAAHARALPRLEHAAEDHVDALRAARSSATQRPRSSSPRPTR
jgi:hypothetical protein